MDFTDEGRLRLEQVVTDGLLFSVTHVAYGTDGYDPVNPNVSLALVPAATSLSAEVFRKEVAANTLDEVSAYRGKETTYTTVGGTEFSDILGEAGLIATVEDPGSTGLASGYEFLIAHAHFPRVILSLYGRLAIKWPLDLTAPAIVYTSTLGILGSGVSITPSIFGAGFGAYALVSGSLPPSLALNPATGEITGTLGAADLLGGSPAGEYTGIVIEADGTVQSPPFDITVLGVSLPEPIFYSPMELDPTISEVFDGSTTHPAAINGSPTAVPGPVGNAVAFVSANGDYLEVTHDPTLDVGVNDYTIVGTTRLSAGNRGQLLNKICLGGSNPGFGIFVEDFQATVYHGDGSAPNLVSTIPYASIDDGNYHTLVWSAERASNGELYVDGLSVGTFAISSQPASVDNVEPILQGAINVGPKIPDADSEDDEIALFTDLLDANQAATCAWLSLRGRSLGSWIKGSGPSKPGYPELTNTATGIGLSLPPSEPAFTTDGDTVTYAAYDPLPTGLAINTSTGEITGVPTIAGNFIIRVAVTDGMNLVLSDPFTINVS